MIQNKEYNKEDVLDESLVVANVRDMSREELEQFADRMRIDRNSFIYRKEEDWKKLEDKIIELETELYFCNRNNKIEEIVNEQNS